jgi:hypothetical protein
MAVNPAEDIVNVWLQDIHGYFTRQNVNVPKQGREVKGKMIYGGKGKEIDILGIKNSGKRIWVEVSVSPNPYLAKKELRVSNAIEMVYRKFDKEKEKIVMEIFKNKPFNKIFVYSERLFRNEQENEFVDKLKRNNIEARCFHNIFNECIENIRHYSVDPTRIYLYYSKFFRQL